MISTHITLNKLKTEQYFSTSDSDFHQIEEIDESLPSRIIFNRGDWYRGLVALEKLEINPESLMYLKKFKKNKKATNSKIGRVKGHADVKIKMSKYLRQKTRPEDGIGDYIKLFRIEVQVGYVKMETQVDSPDSKMVVIYISPNTIFEELQNKYESFLKIQSQNTKLGIKHQEIESWIVDLKEILGQINLEIDERIEKLKHT